MVFGKKHTDIQPATTTAAPTTAAPHVATDTMAPTTMKMPTPVPSVYYDTTDGPLPNPHDPSPKYEKQAPPFQPLKMNNEKQQNKVVDYGNNAEVKRSGTWGRGAGTYGPASGADTTRKPSLAERANTAASGLSDETKGKLSAKEKKDAERLSKIIISEGKAENKHYKGGVKELDHLQKRQKKASRAEQAAGKAAGKAIKEQQRAEAAYHDAKKRVEKALSNRKYTAEQLEMKKEHAAATTEQLNRQAHEVEVMRERKATDDREREAKLAQLKQAIVASS